MHHNKIDKQTEIKPNDTFNYKGATIIAISDDVNIPETCEGCIFKIFSEDCLQFKCFGIDDYAKALHFEFKTITTANKQLDEQEFYELMLAYRNAPIENQEMVIQKFEEVKEWIKRNYEEKV